jgi:hypothetical protein
MREPRELARGDRHRRNRRPARLGRIGLAGGAVLSLVCQGGPSLAGAVSLATGLDISSGGYGEALPTTIVTPDLAIKYVDKSWAIGASTPYLETTGPGNVVPGLGRLGSSPQTAPLVTRDGIGNVAIWARGTILSIAKTDTSVDLKGKIRFGTASAAEGLGTGRNDYSVSLEADQPIGKKASLFASFGRRFPISPPDFPLESVWFGSFGGSYDLADRWTAAMWLDMQQATSDTSGREQEVTADLTYRVSRVWKIDVYAVKGFAAGSPAKAGGVVVTWLHGF